MITFTKQKFKILLLALFLMLANILFAQVEVSHKSGWFYIPADDTLYIKGSLSSLQGNDDPLLNLGKMHISDSVTCYGNNKVFGENPDTITAQIYLDGNVKQILGGDKNIRFGNLLVQNTFDTVTIKTQVDIYGKLQLDYGNVYIPDYLTLDFLYTGRLVGETNAKRVFGNNYSIMHMSRPLITGNTYTNIGGFGLDLTINGNLGVNTHIWRKNVQQVNVSNGSIDRFYTFNPDNNAYVSSPNIYYLDTIELHGNNEENLNMYLSNTSGNTWTEEGGVADTINDKVSTDASLSIVLSDETMLTLAESICDEVPFLHFAEDTIPMCDGAPAWLFAEGTIGMSSVWNNGVINQDSIQVDTAGTYYVSITNLKGCPNTDSIVVVNAPNPITDFDIPAVCVGSVSNFTNQTIITDGTVSYFWDLADSYSSSNDTTSITDPSIIYTNQGSFPVELIATSDLGCSSAETKLAVVYPYPTVDFTIESNCADSMLSIVNLSNVMPTALISYNWDFGNSTTSISETPTYFYDTAGTYSVQLEATSNNCLSTITKDIVINPNPVASFVASPVCLSENTDFINLSTVSSGTNSFSWTFEQGSNSGLINPTYAYSEADTFDVQLTATSNFGCMHDTVISVIVNALPQPIFSAIETCQGDSINFINNSEPTSSFSWDFHGLASSTDFNPTFIFTESGSRTIVLTETNTNSCTNSFSLTIDSKPMPIANFISLNACEEENIEFLNTTSTPSGNLTYIWNFGDSNETTEESPNHIYSTASDYNVQLIAENNGCYDTITKTTSIHPLPILDLGGTITTCAESYMLDAQNNGSSFLWSNQSTEQTLNVQYNGTYWVQVTTDLACVKNDTVEIVLNSIVTPNIGIDSTFCDSTILSAGYPESNYLWSNGATTQTININASETYWVEVTDQNGCVGSDTIIATVVTSVHPDLGSDLSKCEGEITELNPQETGISYLWNNGATENTISISETGTYWIKFTDLNNCVSRDTVEVVYHENPILDLGIDRNYCDSANFDINQPNANYLWENASTEANRTIFTGGSYWAVITNSITGCNTSDTVNISLSATPVVDLGNDVTLCNGDFVTLDANYAGNTFNWNVGDTTQTIIAAATGIYIVNVSTAEACVGSDSVIVSINAPLVPDLGDDFILCTNMLAEITSPINDANYSWAFNGTLLEETNQNIFVTETGELSVIVTTDLGCIAYDTIVLQNTITEIYADYWAATNDIYVGDTIQFINLSYPVPYTSEWDFGDGFYSNLDAPTHTYFFEGVYNAILEVSNGICTDTILKTLTVLPFREENNDTLVDGNQIVEAVLYPNPNNGQFSIDITLLEEDEVYIECFNVQGQLFINDFTVGTEISLQYQRADLPSGIYFIRIRIPDQSKFIKFIKQ